MEAFMITKKTRISKAPLPMLIWSLLVLPLIFGCLGSGFIRETGFTPGVFEGIGLGRRGPIRVRVQMSPAGIEDIVIISHRENAYPGAAAMEELLEDVLETGSTDLDTVSGATFSSRGFLEAVEDALQKGTAAAKPSDAGSRKASKPN
jgi:urocanate reductase